MTVKKSELHSLIPSISIIKFITLIINELEIKAKNLTKSPLGLFP